MQYDIIDRRGGQHTKIGHVASDRPKTAALMAALALKAAYERAGIEPEMFDLDPPFWIEHASRRLGSNLRITET